MIAIKWYLYHQHIHNESLGDERLRDMRGQLSRIWKGISNLDNVHNKESRNWIFSWKWIILFSQLMISSNKWCPIHVCGFISWVLYELEFVFFPWYQQMLFKINPIWIVRSCKWKKIIHLKPLKIKIIDTYVFIH